MEFEDFSEFYKERRNALMSRLKERVFMTDILTNSGVANEEIINEVSDNGANDSSFERHNYN